MAIDEYRDVSRQFLQDNYGIAADLVDLLREAEAYLHDAFTEIDRTADYNQIRLLHIFQKKGVTDYHLHGSTGYGYGDIGRDVLETIFASYFGCEEALVRNQIMSGTHALAIGLYGNLKPGDELISAAGAPYDTLEKIIGIHGETDSLLESGVAYKEIPLYNSKYEDDVDNNGAGKRGDDGYDRGSDNTLDGVPVIDLPRLLDAVGEKTKVVFLQRSKGYQWRRSLCIAELEKVISEVKAKKPDVICMVDNCYCEMVEGREPGEIGADLVIGSLIKNPGGTLAPCGGYIAGSKALVEACGRRLLAPGLRTDLGASLDFTRPAFQGLFQAPHTVAQALKGAVLAGAFFHRLGYAVMPNAADLAGRTDIVQAIRLGDDDRLIRFCQAIQQACPVGASFMPEPAILPGYEHPVIMAGGGFIQGSSSELSADGPLRPPYIAYLQGGFSLAQIRLGLLLAAQALR